MRRRRKNTGKGGGKTLEGGKNTLKMEEETEKGGKRRKNFEEGGKTLGFLYLYSSKEFEPVDFN